MTDPGPITRDASPKALPLVDEAMFRSQFGGDAELASDMIESLASEWDELATGLRPESVRADLERAGHAAHRIRGVLGLLASRQAEGLAERLEQAAGSGDLDGAAALAESLAGVMAPTLEALAATARMVAPELSQTGSPPTGP